MGISRDSRHKRRATGGKREQYRKKRKFELGRQPAMTKIGEKRVHVVRGRGGNNKYRAIRLESGNFSWGSEVCTRKTRILDVVYNASNNELVRTKTLVKGAIVLIDAHPLKSWYEQHYGVEIGKKKRGQKKSAEDEEALKKKLNESKSSHVLRKLSQRQKTRVLDPSLDDQFAAGRLLACVSSRPGQCGRCDGYILEGKELEFYQKKLQAKKKGHKA
uniref:40S ribosomal protein S8 n=1 Tax=Aureoumbra lagunensis TaxID=44058 RepID=A0A7S3JYM8_9STRA